MRKKLAATLSVVLILGLAVLGILAYLTDTDSDVNVMTLGNVDIEQIEEERIDTTKSPENNVTDFIGNDKDEEGKPLFPATIDLTEETQVDGYWPGTNNAVDKLVSVKNTGKSEAYVRTWFAFEMGSMNKETWESKVKLNINETDWSWSEAEVKEMDGKNYYVIYAVHNTPVAPNETTEYSLKQVALVRDATNDDVANFADVKVYGDDNEFEILVFSQAIQTAGFKDSPTTYVIENDGALTADYALAAHFGTEHPWTKLIYVDSFEEMEAVCKTGGKMVLTKDLTYTAEDTVEMIGGSVFLINGKNVTLDLNGYNITIEEDATDIYGAIFFVGNPGGHIDIIGDGNITVKNGLATVVWVLQTGTANIYNGNYVSNSVSHEAMFYSQGNGGVINVYGGTYTYDLDRHLNGGFNVSDQAGGALRIILHDGVLLSRPEYSQHLQGTTNGEQNRIQLAEGCELQETEIDGVTWYQVVKK